MHEDVAAQVGMFPGHLLANWMVKNTEFRLFEAYADPEAKELGTIYQACNFYYVGDNFGSDKLYFDIEFYFGFCHFSSFFYFNLQIRIFIKLYLTFIFKEHLFN